MSKIFIMIFIFVSLFAWEVPHLIRKKEIKELVVFSILAVIGFALSIALIIKSFI
jgi:ABC-type Mn2+/Zn2+ transport system permease subunit